MIPWIIAAWLGLGLATAAAFHLVRRRYRPVPVPARVQAFVRRIEEIVRADHPEVAIRGMLPGRFTMVFEVQGQEVPVPLHQLFRHAAVFPDALPQMVATLIQEVASGGLARLDEHRFGDVAARILPQVRAAAWVAERSPVFGDAGLVSRPLAEDLRVCYVIDDPWSMVFVCRAHLRLWGIDEDALHRLATENLRRLGGDALPVPGPADEPVLVRTGDGYDASRVLLLDPERAQGLLVALPERDTLWLGSGGDLPALMASSRDQSIGSAYPVSPKLYRFREGTLEALPETSGPAPGPT
jgi:hypothetical protein